MAVQPWRGLVLGGLVALVLAACGSTVQDTAGGGPGPGALAGDGLGGTVPGGDGLSFGPDAGPATSTDLAGGPTGDGFTGDTIGGQAEGTADTAVPTAGGSGGAGPGVTANEVYVGLVYDVNAGALNQAAGVGAITSGDSQANTRAIIDDINKRGGVAGRKLVPVYAEFDSTSTQTFDQQYAAVCQKFTQDNPRVFAVEGAGLVESYRQCISKAGVSIISSGLPSSGQAELDRYPGFVEQGYPNLDRLAAHYVTPLVEQQYFTPWDAVTGAPAVAGAVKVGVLTYNDRDFSSAVDRFLVPALKRLGHDPQVAKIAPVTTAGDYGAQAAAVKSAQLSFAANGVTHVIPFESNGGLSTFFLPTARSQGYYPRYGVSTASGFEALIEAGVTEPRQMNGAVGFGWVPSIDLPGALNPPDGPYSNANRRHCLEVMKANGITFDSGNAEGIALNSCSNLYLLKVALDQTSSVINRISFIRAVESLGTSYQRAGGVGQEFRPGRRDPSNRAYHWRYVADCNCFQYTGPPRPIP